MSAGERQIRLLRGEGFFSVTKDPARLFVVQSGDGWVKVVGTQFSVERATPRLQMRQPISL